MESEGGSEGGSDGEGEGDNENETEERFKGLTDFQIRQILKKEKEEQRAKKKEEVRNGSELIHNIVRKKPKTHKRLTHNKNKGLIKIHPDDCSL